MTDLEVSPICLGTGSLGSDVVGDAAFDLLDSYFELSGRFIDTAHNYGDWVEGNEKSASEKILGKWIRQKRVREQIVLATKGGHFYFDTPNEPRLSKEELTSDLQGSLSALQTDFIDLYWLHRDDPSRPVEDIIGTLNEFVRAGHIRYFGASNWKVNRIREAQEYAAASGLMGFVADQPLWNAAVLAGPPYNDSTLGWMDDERFQFHIDSGMSVIPYQSNAYGLFQRMHDGTLDQMNQGFRSFYKAKESTDRFNRMQQVMRDSDLTITQVTLGYLKSQPFTTVPIVGSKNVQQIKDSMTALHVVLTPAQIKYIENG